MQISALKLIQLRMAIKIHFDEYGPVPITLLVLGQNTPTGMRRLVERLVGKLEAGLRRGALIPGLATVCQRKPKQGGGHGSDAGHRSLLLISSSKVTPA